MEHREFTVEEQTYVKKICSDILERYNDEKNIAVSLASNIFINLIANIFADKVERKDLKVNLTHLMVAVLEKLVSQIELVKVRNERD